MPTHASDAAKQATLHHVIAAFRDRARATDLGRPEVIAQALQVMGSGVPSEQVPLTTRSAAHPLVGSARMFGFGEASRRGRASEALVDEGDGTEDMKVRAEHGLDQVVRLRDALADPAALATPAAGPTVASEGCSQ